eukprot:1603002-Amphidinium_carterae.1
MRSLVASERHSMPYCSWLQAFCSPAVTIVWGCCNGARKYGPHSECQTERSASCIPVCPSSI